MTKLTHIEVEGFKGIESLEFEPTDINLITGRNNTGKTSFLEAVNLSLDPEFMHGFKDNLGKVVNVDYNSGYISVDVVGNNHKVRIRNPTEEEFDTHFIEAIGNALSRLISRQQTLTDYPPNQTKDKDKLLSEILVKAARQTASREFEDSSNVTEKSCVILDINGGEYTYVNFGEEGNERILSTAYEVLEEILREEFNPENFEKTYRGFQIESEEYGIILLDLGSTEYFRKGWFTENTPYSNDIKFIKPGESSGITAEIQKEQDALKVDNIGDYIKQAELVDDLKTFTLDYLVFENEERGKWQIPFEFMGDGFKTIVGLLWELMDDESSTDIVLIEEPENHLHPGYIRELVHFLIDLAREEDIQLFITTHDNDFINDFFEDDIPDEKREYLEEEFSLVKMDDFGADIRDYEESEQLLKDLHMDLRGI